MRTMQQILDATAAMSTIPSIHDRGLAELVHDLALHVAAMQERDVATRCELRQLEAAVYIDDDHAVPGGEVQT